MEVFKLGKIIDNQVIDVHLTLHKVEDVAIAKNDIYYKEIDTTQVFANGDSKEFDAVIVELKQKR